MKILFTLLIVTASIVTGFAQAPADKPMYKRFPTVPPLQLLLTDSSTTFTEKNLKKNTNTIIILFSPDCDHCKHETEDIIKNMSKFKNIQIVMTTMMPFEKMTEFYKHYNLSKYKNIIVGRDYKYLLATFYTIRNLPFMAFYNKKGNLIDVFEGSLPVDKVLEKFK